MTKFLMAAVIAGLVTITVVEAQKSVGSAASLIDGVALNFERLGRAMAERGYR